MSPICFSVTAPVLAVDASATFAIGSCSVVLMAGVRHMKNAMHYGCKKHASGTTTRDSEMRAGILRKVFPSKGIFRTGPPKRECGVQKLCWKRDVNIGGKGSALGVVLFYYAWCYKFSTLFCFRRMCC